MALSRRLSSISSFEVQTNFTPITDVQDDNKNCILCSVIKVIFRCITEIISVGILFLLSVILTLLFGILSGFYSRDGLIIWFMFAALIVSFFIYIICVGCKFGCRRFYESRINIKRFTIIRISILLMECLVIFVMYEWIGSMVAPNLTIFLNLYSSSISMNILPYNKSMVIANDFFRCNLDFEPVKMRDISESRLVNALLSGVDFTVGAYTNLDTIYVPTKNIVQQQVLIHELTHIWQYQNGMFYGIKGIKNLFKVGMPKQSNYRYDDLSDSIAIGKHFLEFDLEQQATIIQNYYRHVWQYNLSCTNEQCDDNEQSLEFYAKQSVLRTC
eukprot:552382_1